MTTINPGTDFSDQQVSLKDHLNNLLDDATLTNLTATALISGIHFFNNSRPGSPAEGDNNVDSTTGLLETHDGSAWSFDRTDPMTWTLTNGFGATMTAGDVVVAKAGSDDTFTQFGVSTDASMVIGVLSENTADSALGQVHVRGLVTLLVGGSCSPGDWLANPTSGTSDASVIADPTNAGVFAAGMFGILLESTSSTTLAQAYIWR